MSTTKKALYAAVGVGGLAIDQAKGLSKRISALPTRIASGAGDLRDLPAKARSLREEGSRRVGAIYASSGERDSKVAKDAKKRATRTFKDLTKRGEKLVKSVSKSAPTKAAIEQTKIARSRVKAAATTIRKAAKADAEAVGAAADTVVERAG